MGCKGREALEIKLERHGYETAVLDVSEAAAYLAGAIPGRTGPGAASSGPAVQHVGRNGLAITAR